MLLTFKCRNFASIREPIVLSLIGVNSLKDAATGLIPTPDKSVSSIRSAVIYGANASGKSNVLQAMRSFARIVSDSWRKWEPTQQIPIWNPFLLDQMSKETGTQFEIDFVMGDSTYIYGFEYNNSYFTSEWLIDQSTSRQRVLFRRSTNSDGRVSIQFPNRNLTSAGKGGPPLEILIHQTRGNSLFLSAAAQANHPLLSEIFSWITKRFKWIGQYVQPKMRTATMCSSSRRKEQILSLLRFADLGVIDLEVSEEEPPEEMRKFLTAVQKAMKELEPSATQPDLAGGLDPRHSIHLIHRGEGDKSYRLEFEQESKGTQAFFVMLGPILDLLDSGGLGLIDELQGVLHPALASRLIALFNNPEFNPRGAQLVVATHDTNLLNSANLRRDQIWLAEKTLFGATSLKSIVDFKPRIGQDLEAAYLSGRFGALPEFNEGALMSLVSSGSNATVELSAEESWEDE